LTERVPHLEVLLKVDLHQLLPAKKTPNPQTAGPSVSLAETEEISKTTERDPDSLHQ
jgi:hypothetical protein